MSVDLLKPCYCPCLEILSENFSFPGNRHLDSTITAWKLWSPRLMSACTWAMPQALSVPASYNPFRRLFFFCLSYLCRLPASLDWSAGLPRPDGSTAVPSWPGCDEQSARNPSAGRDGLLPNHVFLSGVCLQLEKPDHKLPLSRVNTTGHSLCWAVSRVMDAWPVHTSVDLDWDIGEKVCRCHSKCLGFPMLNWICSHINFLFVEGHSSLVFYTGRRFGHSIKMILDRKPNMVFLYSLK